MSDPKALVIDGLFVSSGSRCNHNCTFCNLSDRTHEAPLPEVEKAALQARQWGYRRLILSGGEPTVRRDLLAVASMTHGHGLKLGLVTNGRMLLYPQLLSGLLARGLDSVLLWLHAPDAEVHDQMVKTPKAFEQTSKVLAQLLAIPFFTVEVRTVLAPQNVALLPRMVRWLGRLAGSERLYQTLVYAAPGGLADAPNLLTPDQAATAIAEAVAAGKKAHIPVYHEGIPECVMGTLAPLDIRRFPRERLPNPQFEECLAAPLSNAVRVLACAECLATRSCPGLPVEWVRAFPGLELKPTRGVRSNSFDFVESHTLEGFLPRSEQCPGYALELDGGPVPNVLLCGDSSTAVYRTDTADFSTDEIHDIKHVHQQFYIDTSTKVALDDYEGDVRQLRMVPECRECPTRERCATAWRIDPKPPFYREERWLRGEIGRMQGRVLDVGCGDLRYQGIIRELVQSRKIEYQGLDPDRSALERLRASGIEMKIHLMDIEEFSGEPGYFDYILMLRSINHFKDLSVTFNIIQKLLRNYGSLIIADCIPFALLRSKAKAQEAHGSMVPIFEHYRNFTSQQVLEFIRKEKLPFVVNIHRPVFSKTSNLWLMKLIKIDKNGQHHD